MEKQSFKVQFQIIVGENPLYNFEHDFDDKSDFTGLAEETIKKVYEELINQELEGYPRKLKVVRHSVSNEEDTVVYSITYNTLTAEENSNFNLYYSLDSKFNKVKIDLLNAKYGNFFMGIYGGILGVRSKMYEDIEKEVKQSLNLGVANNGYYILFGKGIYGYFKAEDITLNFKSLGETVTNIAHVVYENFSATEIYLDDNDIIVTLLDKVYHRLNKLSKISKSVTNIDNICFNDEETDVELLVINQLYFYNKDSSYSLRMIKHSVKEHLKDVNNKCLIVDTYFNEDQRYVFFTDKPVLSVLDAFTSNNNGTVLEVDTSELTDGASVEVNQRIFNVQLNSYSNLLNMVNLILENE